MTDAARAITWQRLRAMYPMLDSRLLVSSSVPLDHKLTAIFLMVGAAPRNVLNFPWLHAVHEHARHVGCDVLLKDSMGNLGFSFDGEGALPSCLARGRWRRLAIELWAGRGSPSLRMSTGATQCCPSFRLAYRRD